MIVIGRISDPKSSYGLGREFATCSCVLQSRAIFQILCKKVLSPFVQEFKFFFVRFFFFGFFWITRVLLYIYTSLTCQYLYTIPEVDAFHLHMEGNRIPSLAASETFEYLFVFCHRKRWRFFAMKRAESGMISTDFLEVYISTY